MKRWIFSVVLTLGMISISGNAFFRRVTAIHWGF